MRRHQFFSVLSAFILSSSASYSAWSATEQVVNHVLISEPPQLNSLKSTDTQSSMILGHINEGLTRYGKSGEIVPGVAQKWEIKDDGATFNLRKNAKWSDGKPVTAKDFVFAWRTVLDPKTASEYAFILYPVKNAEAINKGEKPVTDLGVVAVDDYTLKVTFEKPCGYFLGLTAMATYIPVREDFYNEKKDRYAADAADMLSNGPFVLTKWVHGSEMTLTKSPTYWNKAAIALDRIEIPYMTADLNARFNFFKDKKVDILERIGRDDLPKAQAQGYRVKSFQDGSVWYMEFNFRDGKVTRNKNLRKAIQAVFNPTEFVSRVVGIPGTKPGMGLIPAWIKGTKETFRKEYPLSVNKPDLGAARKYLELAKKELGVAKIPPLVWLCDDTAAAGREAEYLQNLLKTTLGIELRIDKQIFKQRLAKMLAGDFDIVAAGWGPDFSDPMTFAELKTSWNENNRGRYTNPEYDKQIRVAQSTSDTKVRMQAMANAEKLLLEDVGVVMTYERTIAFLQQDWLEGAVRHPVGPDPDFTFARIKKH